MAAISPRARDRRGCEPRPGRAPHATRARGGAARVRRPLVSAPAHGRPAQATAITQDTPTTTRATPLAASTDWRVLEHQADAMFGRATRTEISPSGSVISISARRRRWWRASPGSTPCSGQPFFRHSGLVFLVVGRFSSRSTRIRGSDVGTWTACDSPPRTIARASGETNGFSLTQTGMYSGDRRPEQVVHQLSGCSRPGRSPPPRCSP